MPELPEVLTTINYLKPRVLKKTITKVWIDKNTKIDNQTSKDFSKQLQNSKIIKIDNIGKYIIFYLSNNLLLIIHQKISGHLLFGNYIQKTNSWTCQNKNISQDPNNRFIRILFLLSSGQSLALSDPRRLIRITLVSKDNFSKINAINKIGPDPFSKEFSLDFFVKKLSSHQKLTVKQGLLNQNIVAGIGNIYADEILFKSKVLPFRKISTLHKKEIYAIFKNINIVLLNALKNKGTTFSNYRNPNGKSGQNQTTLKVYGRKNLPCTKCKEKIQSIKINNRGSYFCAKCQK